MLILGTTQRILHCGHATHRLDDDRVVVGLVDQLCNELGRNWYAAVTYSNGTVAMRGLTDKTPGPNFHVREVMLRTAAKLNRDLHHEGCWIVVWYMERLLFMWRDGDGDSAFIVQVDEPWPRIRTWPIVEFCDRAEISYQEFREMLRKVELKPEHMIMKAQGELPNTTRH